MNTMNMIYRIICIGLLSILVLSSCAIKPISVTTEPIQPTPTPSALYNAPEIPLLEQRALMNVARIDQLISFDGIRPIYRPLFVNAVDADMEPDDLVIGIAIADEAKAYPVGVLRFREMVNDEISGIPILVSW